MIMPSTVNLSVNINKIALLRNARGSEQPDILAFAKLAINEGAAGITVHPRPDQRHITANDTIRLGQYLQSIPQEFNIEGNPFEGKRGSFPGLLNLIEKAKPAQVTLVPDTLTQRTSDHGWDFNRDGHALKPIINQLKKKGIRVSVFVDPTEEALHGAKKSGAQCIEFYTENYAKAHQKGKGEITFSQ